MSTSDFTISASPPMLLQENLHRPVQWLQKEKLEIVVKRLSFSIYENTDDVESPRILFILYSDLLASLRMISLQ